MGRRKMDYETLQRPELAGVGAGETEPKAQL